MPSKDFRTIRRERHQQPDVVTPEDVYNVTLSHRDSTTVPLLDSTSRKDKKTSFYLTDDQVTKLDDFAHEHKKRTGQRINRNDIVRFLIDGCTIEALDTLHI